MIHFTEHFSQAELECKCGQCEYTGMDADFMEKLQIVRIAVAKPMSLNSAYRCAAYDSSIGGAGVHPTRKAVDIRCSGNLAHAILVEAAKAGFTGFGISQKGAHAGRFIHLDTTEGATRPWVWSY